MKNGWQYVQTGGTNEKMAPMTLASNVLISENGPSLASALPSNPNLLINGDFQVWQRGAYFNSNTCYYSADRVFALPEGGSYIVTEKHSEGLEFVINVASTSNMGYRIEKNEWNKWVGKKLTLSTRMRHEHGTSFRYAIFWGNAVFDETGSSEVSFTDNATNWITHAASFTITAPADGDVFVQWFRGAGSGVGYHIAEYVKLEFGSIATPNSPRPYAQELAMCQRYYYDYNPSKSAYCVIHAATWGDASTNYLQFNMDLPVFMRIAPILVKSGSYQLLVNGGDWTPYITGALLSMSSINKVQITISLSRTIGSIVGFIYRINNDTTAKFALDAEIY